MYVTVLQMGMYHPSTQMFINTVLSYYKRNGDMFRRIFMSSSGQYSRKFKISQEIILHIKHVMVMYVHTDLKMT